MRVGRDLPLSELSVAQYDSLLLPGCMDPRGIIDNADVHAFLRKFDPQMHIIACISSSPLLLLRAGVLNGKKYIAGCIKSELLEEGFKIEEMQNMRDVTELKNPDGTVTKMMTDGNLLTAVGSAFIDFGVKFGQMLQLDFDPAWYGQR